MSEINDKELVIKVKAGDFLAYEELVKRYEFKLIRYIHNWTRDDGLAEEVVQDALFKLYKNINKVDEAQGFAGYLYKIARNELMSRFRKEKMVLPLIEEYVGDNGEHLYEDIDRKDTQKKVKKALGEIKDKHRKILELYFFEELSYKRIGELLGVPLNTIKTNLRRAKAAMLNKLKNEKR